MNNVTFLTFLLGTYHTPDRYQISDHVFLKAFVPKLFHLNTDHCVLFGILIKKLDYVRKLNKNYY